MPDVGETLRWCCLRFQSGWLVLLLVLTELVLLLLLPPAAFASIPRLNSNHIKSNQTNSIQTGAVQVKKIQIKSPESIGLQRPTNQPTLPITISSRPSASRLNQPKKQPT